MLRNPVATTTHMVNSVVELASDVGGAAFGDEMSAWNLAARWDSAERGVAQWLGRVESQWNAGDSYNLGASFSAFAPMAGLPKVQGVLGALGSGAYDFTKFTTKALTENYFEGPRIGSWFAQKGVLNLDVFVTNNGLTISSNAVNGNPSAIARGFGELSTRQSSVLETLPEYGSTTITGKSFGQTDLAALTAATGDEFAMFTTGGRRLIYRGDASSVPITPEIASDLSSQGWRWSSHTHPGFEVGVLRSSPGDQAVLRAMSGNQSAIFNSMGQRGIFTPTGDSLNGWKPW